MGVIKRGENQIGKINGNGARKLLHLKKNELTSSIVRSDFEELNLDNSKIT